MRTNARTRGAVKHSKWKTDFGNYKESDMQLQLALQAREEWCVERSLCAVPQLLTWSEVVNELSRCGIQ